MLKLRKGLLFIVATILVAIGQDARSQGRPNTSTLPTGAGAVTPQFKIYGSLTDSLKQYWTVIPGGGANRMLSLTEYLKYYYSSPFLGSLSAGNNNGVVINASGQLVKSNFFGFDQGANRMFFNPVNPGYISGTQFSSGTGNFLELNNGGKVLLNTSSQLDIKTTHDGQTGTQRTIRFKGDTIQRLSDSALVLFTADADTTYIKNGNDTPQAASFNISGTAQSGAVFTNYLQSQTLQANNISINGTGQGTQLNAGNMTMYGSAGSIFMQPGLITTGLNGNGGFAGFTMSSDTSSNITVLSVSPRFLISTSRFSTSAVPNHPDDVVRLQDLAPYALSSEVVHSDGNDTLRGTKVFLNSPQIYGPLVFGDGSGNTSINFKNLDGSIQSLYYNSTATGGTTGDLEWRGNSFSARKIFTNEVNIGGYGGGGGNYQINNTSGLKRLSDNKSVLFQGDVPTYSELGGYLPLSGGNMTGEIILPSATPVNPLAAAPKAYIDNLLTGITWKNAVRVKTTGNITLSGIQTIDGVTGAADSRILVNSQTDATQNGIWVMKSGAWLRGTDADSGDEILTSTVAVTAGTLNKNTQWTNLNTVSPTIGTDAINYGQISGAGTYAASNGIDLTGNVFTLNSAYTRGLFSATSPLTYNSTTGAFGIQLASGTQAGALSAADWSTFNSKQPAGAYVTASNVANPTALVGLTAVNGTATTFMRSDAAPAIDQTIAPVWTGLHTFQRNGIGSVSTDGILLSNVTASTSGTTIQYSPSMHLMGSAWNTTTSSSDTKDWVVQIRPVSGSSTGSTYAIMGSTNGAPLGSRFSIDDGGSVTTSALALTLGRLSLGSTSIPASYLAMQGGVTTSTAYSTTGAFGINQYAATYNSTAAANTGTNTAINYFGVPTLSAANAQTLPTASTMWINGAPTAGSNVSITNAYALYVNQGASYFNGNATITGVTTTPRIVLGGTGATTSSLGVGGIYLQVGGSTITDQGTASGGTIANVGVNTMASNALGASNTSVTYTNASTFYIAGPPTQGTNVTITNPYAFYVNSGASYFGGYTSSAGFKNAVASVKTANYTTTDNDYYVPANSTAGSFNITLLSTAAIGTTYVINNRLGTANSVTVVGTINGATNYTLNATKTVTVYKTATASNTWDIVYNN